MVIWLVILVEVMMAVAIFVQLAYLRSLRKSGSGVSGAVRVITYGNITLLLSLEVGLLAWAILNPGRW